MYLYLIYFILSFFSFVEMNFGKKNLTKMFNIFLFIFFLISFVRWERGTDWQPYLDFFNNISYNTNTSDFEFLFVKLNVFSAMISDSYTFLLFLQAILIYFFTWRSLKSFSISPIFSLLIWFSFSFAGIFFVRQTIAVALVLFSFTFIFDRKLKLFITFVLIASLFHQTAIIFLPAYFCYKLVLSRKQVLVMLVGAFFLSLISSFFFQYLSNFGIASISDRAVGYLEAGSEDTFGSMYSPYETMLRGLLYRFVGLSIIFYFLFDTYKSEIKLRVFGNLYFFGVLIFILFVPVSVTFSRFCNYFEISQVFIYPYLVYRWRKPYYRDLILFSLILFFLFRLYGVIAGYENLYVPFKSIFNKELKVEIR